MLLILAAEILLFHFCVLGISDMHMKRTVSFFHMHVTNPHSTVAKAKNSNKRARNLFRFAFEGDMA